MPRGKQTCSDILSCLFFPQVFRDFTFVQTALIESYIFKTTSLYDLSLCSSTISLELARVLLSLTSVSKASQILL